MIKTVSVADGVEALQQGEVIAYPTEAVFGLGCDPWNADAVIALLDLKRRSIEKGFILVASSFDQVEPLLEPLSEKAQASILPTWPGPVTWLCPARSDVPRCLTGNHQTLAVRVSAHPVVKALCEVYEGPIVSTSANISNHPPARSANDVAIQFHKQVDVIVEGKCGDSDSPTVIRDAVTGEYIRH